MSIQTLKILFQNDSGKSIYYVVINGDVNVLDSGRWCLAQAAGPNVCVAKEADAKFKLEAVLFTV